MKIKNLYATKLMCIFTLFNLPFAGIARADDEPAKLSPEWYVLPEDMDNNSLTSSLTQTPSLSFAQSERGFDGAERLVTSNSKAFDKMDMLTGRNMPPPNAPANWAPWHAENLILDLGVSVQGSLGVIVAGGAVAASVYWRHKKPGNLTAPTEFTPPDLTFDSSMSSEDLKRRIDPIVNALVATKRVTDRTKISDGLSRYITDLQYLMGGMDNVAEGHWKFSKLRFDVNISGAGIVGPGTTVGGAANLRFEWVPVANMGGSRPVVANSEDEGEQRRYNLHRFLSSMAMDLDTIGTENWTGSGFKLSQFAVGIGLFGKVNFGVATGSLAVMGRAYFTRSNNLLNSDNSLTKSIDPEIGYVTANVNPKHMAFAKANHIAFNRESNGSVDWIQYAVDRAKFRQGLVKATRFSTALAERTQRNPNKKWEVYMIEPQFTLSISGTINIVTIGGRIAMNMIFTRVN